MGMSEMNQNVFCKNCHRIPDQCRCNTAPRELSDEEIMNLALEVGWKPNALALLVLFARAILKKASEK